MTNQIQQHWVIVPAAGIGQRMGADRPKQYLPLLDDTVLGVTLAKLVAGIQPQAVVLALNPEDTIWPSIAKPDVEIIETEGGSERCDSVFNALTALQHRAKSDDWVWVHDAARPCVRVDDLQALSQSLPQQADGMLMAARMTDTVKQANAAQQAIVTVDRNQLWRALTPQVFRYGLLYSALQSVLKHGQQVTDDAQAMELSGYKPALFEGSPDNIKITSPGDLELAELYLSRQIAEEEAK